MKRNRWMFALAVSIWLTGPTASLFAAVDATAVCAGTPTAALLAAKTGAAAAASTGTHGFRVEAVRWDPLLRQSWAIIQSCDHGERPSLAMLTDLPGPHVQANGSLFPSTAQASRALPMVRVGDMVRLWKSDGNAQIELMATSEENGAVGTHIRLRLIAAKDADGQPAPAQYLGGVVRGPADVELER